MRAALEAHALCMRARNRRGKTRLRLKGAKVESIRGYQPEGEEVSDEYRPGDLWPYWEAALKAVREYVTRREMSGHPPQVIGRRARDFECEIVEWVHRGHDWGGIHFAIDFERRVQSKFASEDWAWLEARAFSGRKEVNRRWQERLLDRLAALLISAKVIERMPWHRERPEPTVVYQKHLQRCEELFTIAAVPTRTMRDFRRNE